MLGYFVLIFFALLAYYIYTWLNNFWKSNTPGLGPVATLKSFRKGGSLSESLKKLNVRRGFYHVWFGPKYWMMATDPDAAQFLLKCPHFIKSRAGFQLKYVEEKLEKHVSAMNGDDWKRHRLFLNWGFKSEAYQSYFPTFQEVNQKLLNKWAALPKGEDVECSSWLSKFTLDLLGQSVFHYDFQNLDSIQNPYYEAYKVIISNGGVTHRVLTLFFPFLQHLPIPGTIRIKNAVDKVKTLFSTVIEEHKKKKYNDILDTLLQASEEGSQISQLELYSNIWVFFLAGHETTSTALNWALVELADKQDIQEKLYNEIIKAYGHNTPSFEQLHPKPVEYLDYFIQENLRLHPPAFILPTRLATTDVYYENTNQIIPKGAIVGMDVRSIHRNPDFWEEPEKFDPERFTPERKKGRHRYAYVPFSLGNRQCIGNEFS